MTAAASRIIQRSLNSGGPWTTVATVTPAATTYQDTGLTNDTEYFYRVISVNAQGNSPPSNVASATPTGAPSNNLLTDLVHWWEMDEASATRVDSQGSLDLAVQGGAGGIPGRNVIGGDGADFETTYGAKRLESADAAATVGGLSKLTFAGWVVMDTKPSNFRAFWIYGNYATGFGGSGFGLLCRYNPASDRFRFTASGGGPVVNVNWSAAPVIGQAYLIACTVDLDNDEIGISVDGAAPVTAAFTPSSYNSGGSGWRVVVGNYQQAFQRPPDAGIARLGFWSRVLDSTDLTDLYNSGAGLKYADLQ